ncbi:hypothetical protein [Devosia sp. DBB001]|nr:hypothetical protein [Devosia sp. DBB001]
MASKAVIDTLIAEAGGEGRKGLIAAAWALQQRAEARGMTLDQVVRQPGQFEGYSNPGSGAQKAQQNSKLRSQVEAIVEGVQKGTIPNPVPGADHFLSGNAKPGWSKNMDLVATIGGHRFYASGDVPKSAMGNSALAAIDSVAPAPLPSSLPALRSAYAPESVTAEGLAIRPVSTLSIDPLTGMPRAAADAPALPAPLPAAATNATIARTMASLAPRGEASSRITPLPSSMTAPRNLATPILQGNGQVIDPAALTLWDEGMPDIGLAALPSRPASGQSQAPAREATMAPSRVFSAPKEAKTAASSTFEQKYGDLVPLVTPKPSPEPAGSLQRQIAYENAGLPDTRVASTPKASAPAPSPKRPTTAELQAIRDVPALPTPRPDPGTTRTAALDLGTMPSLSELGDFRNPPVGTALTFKTSTDRLLPNQIVDPPTNMRVGGVSTKAVAPIPAPAPARTAVATMLDVTPLPTSTPTVPVPGVRATGAPVPMPRLDRPSSILPSVPLPGVLGMAQGFSKAINNASGPFKSGIDNLIYQGMRGGNQYAPGAATARAGGYLYAPNGNGGWINVGRDPNFSSSSGSSSGGGMSPVRGENKYDADTNSWSRK